MQINALEFSGKIGSFLGINTGKYRIQIVKTVYGIYQRHIWEKVSGEWDADAWIKSYITTKKGWDRLLTKEHTKIKLDLEELRSIPGLIDEV